MLDLKFICENFDVVCEVICVKNVVFDLDDLLQCDCDFVVFKQCVEVMQIECNVNVKLVFKVSFEDCFGLI